MGDVRVEWHTTGWLVKGECSSGDMGGRRYKHFSRVVETIIADPMDLAPCGYDFRLRAAIETVQSEMDEFERGGDGDG